MTLETLYWVLAIFGGAILIIRFILFMIGIGDSGPDSDFNGEINIDHDLSSMGDHGDGTMNLDHDGADHGPGIMSYLSLQSLSGFFLLFGLVGQGTLQINFLPIFSLLSGLAAGFITAWSVTKIYSLMQKLQSSGNLNIQTALGKQGKVYLTIPAQGTGVVSIILQGTLRTLDAVSDDGTIIPTDSLVQVTQVTANQIIMVRSINENKVQA
jgi:hypothetical protein